MGDFKDSNATTGCVANKGIDCRICAPKVMKETAKNIEDAINSNKGTSSFAMLKHWAEGSGNPVFWDVKLLRDNEEIFSNNNILDEEDISRGRYKKAIHKYFIEENPVFWEEKFLYTMEAGATDFWSKDYHAYHAYQLYSRGKFSFSKTDEEYTISSVIEYNWYDPYDWHKDKAAYYASLIYGIDDENLSDYELCGYAKAFIMYSTWHQTITLTVGKEELTMFREKFKKSIREEALNNPELDKSKVIDIVRKHIIADSFIDNIIWGKIIDGKAPEDEIGSLDLWREKNHKALTTNYDGEEQEMLKQVKYLSKEQLLKAGLPLDLKTTLEKLELPFFKEDLSKKHIHYKTEGVI